MNKCMKKINLDMKTRLIHLINKDTSLWMMDQKVAIIHPISKKEQKKLKPKKKKLQQRKKKKQKPKAKSNEIFY